MLLRVRRDGSDFVTDMDMVDGAVYDKSLKRLGRANLVLSPARKYRRCDYGMGMRVVLDVSGAGIPYGAYAFRFGECSSLLTALGTRIPEEVAI